MAGQLGHWVVAAAVVGSFVGLVCVVVSLAVVVEAVEVFAVVVGEVVVG